MPAEWEKNQAKMWIKGKLMQAIKIQMVGSKSSCNKMASAHPGVENILYACFFVL